MQKHNFLFSEIYFPTTKFEAKTTRRILMDGLGRAQHTRFQPANYSQTGNGPEVHFP